MRHDQIFAHSLPTGDDTSRWEPLHAHLASVGARAQEFAEVFGAGKAALAGGLLHDIGKCSNEVQDYYRGRRTSGPDHSTAGARVAYARYGLTGRLLAFAIAGHHSGLMNGSGYVAKGRSLSDRLDAKYRIPAYDDWEACVQDLPHRDGLLPAGRFISSDDYPGFHIAFLARMIFSCLVDADFLETEAFYARANGGEPPARGGTITQTHLDRIRAHMATRRKEDTLVNRLRSEILDHAIGKASLSPGRFTLTVPTGGGKTLASLSFALHHALMHGLRRIVYVIPFTSIIEQTAETFRAALNAQHDVLEHHTNFDWDQREPAREKDDEAESSDGLAKLRRDAENWDAPIIVTTTVQFFESLFAARTSRARKLHNLAKSVIVLDEVQALPLRLLRPCMAALDELARNYGASVVLCTATQPALRKQDAALPQMDGRPVPGFDIGDDRELAPFPRKLYESLKRVRVEWRGSVTDAEIAQRFAEQSLMLCIVNTRGHARELFELIRHLPGARHLTTLMHAKHRRKVLAQVKLDLANGLPVRLVATSLIEAGVDVDFPEVWRAATGIDSLAQAAGRSNREGRLEGRLGVTVMFEPADSKLPNAFAHLYQAARPILRSGVDPLSLEAVQRYFRELYHDTGFAGLDAGKVGENRYPILREIEETFQSLDIPFATIAEVFRLIDDVMVPVLILSDEEAKEALDVLAHAPYPPVKLLRRLQQYTVPVPRDVRGRLLATGAAQAINETAYGDRFVYLASDSLYDSEFGLKLDDPTWRASEANIL